MPQLAGVSLTDRTPVTPVVRAFVPRDVQNGVGAVVFNAGTLIGEQRLTISMKKIGTRYKGEVRLTLPVVTNETINGIVSPKIVRAAYITTTVSWDEKSSFQERDDAVGLMANALSVTKTLVNDTLVKCEGVY